MYCPVLVHGRNLVSRSDRRSASLLIRTKLGGERLRRRDVVVRQRPTDEKFDIGDAAKRKSQRVWMTCIILVSLEH